MPKNLLIVESPAKAKTIEKYLGPDFRVLASVGHIRKDVKVDVAHDFAVTYEIDPEHKKTVAELKKAVKFVDNVYLATDEDREGESISWHLAEVLKLPLSSTPRLTFHEITKPALEEALKHPRIVNMNMVSSQQARQTLDMLVGYDLSGVVRKKVPGAVSAGRVQSPALRLIVEREKEIEAFESKSTFKLSATFEKSGQSFPATVEKFELNDEKSASELLDSLKSATFSVENLEKKDAERANPVPLTTAALQIEASSRLGFSARTTMSAAQGLYQAGHITYHRTDSLNLSNQALAAMASYIEKTYGKNYLKVRHFKTKSAGAQEAHEAIRPSHIEVASAGKNDYEKKLYSLIRSRTLATQMSPAKVARTVATITPSSNKDLKFTAKGETILFDGFLKVYGSMKETALPDLQKGDLLTAEEILARETFSNPPARFTEGSLVKKLEELGIGRPSTYASILTAIQSRGYVVKGEGEGRERKVRVLSLKNGEIAVEKDSEKSGSTKGKLLPTPIGELVSGFLTDNFANIVDYSFTASIEEDLDKIAEQKLDRVTMLRDFYAPFKKTVEASEDIARYNNARLLGTDPETGFPIYAKIGKNGGFIQLGEVEKVAGVKPRFAPLPKRKTVKTVTFEDALKQLALPALPRNLGRADDGAEIIAASGPFGPYLKAGNYNIQLKSDDPYTISFDRAKELYAEKLASILKDFGDIMVINGAYGPYVKGPGRFNTAKLPKDTKIATLTKEQCEEILKNKPKKSRARRKVTKKK